MERFEPKENVMSGEKNEYGRPRLWMAICNYACGLIVDLFYIALITSIMFIEIQPFINYNIFPLYYDL